MSLLCNIEGKSLDIEEDGFTKKNLNKLSRLLNRYGIDRLLDILPCGVSIAIDKKCRTVIHNSKAMLFFQEENQTAVDLSVDRKPFRVLANGVELRPEEMPLPTAIKQGKCISDCNLRFIWNNGVIKQAILQAYPLMDERGEIMGGILITQDETERRKMQPQLEKSEETVQPLPEAEYYKSQHFEQCIDTMLDGFCILQAMKDEQGKVIDFIIEYVNEAACKSGDFARERLNGKKLSQISPRLLKGERVSRLCRLVESDDPFLHEEYYRGEQIFMQDGGIYDIKAVKLESGVAITWRNVMEKIRMGQALRSQQRELELLVSSYPDIIVRLDRELRFLYVNPEYERQYNTTLFQVMGESWQNVEISCEYTERLTAYIRQVFESGREEIFESWYKSYSEPYRRYYQTKIVPELNTKGQITSVLLVSRDITQVKKVQEEMTRIDRLNMVGEMAASVAHEIRNPMTVIKGYTQYMMKKAEESNCVKYQAILSELERVNQIVAGYLALASNKRADKVPRDINGVIEAIYPLLYAEVITESVELCVELAPDLPMVELDEGEFKQLIFNLIRNAMDAMGNVRGRVTIKTQTDGIYVYVCIQDMGEGISPEMQERIFEPFYTTRKERVGLGLSVCRRIVDRHKGKITVDSRLSVGTIVTVALPTIC